MNFDQQPEYAQSRGFGKLFGGPEGEMTAQGELRCTGSSLCLLQRRRLDLHTCMRGLGAPLAMLPGRNVGYAPMGSSGYDPQLDPQVNQDLRERSF